MFIKRLICACLLSISSTTSLQAAPELLPMPKTVAEGKLPKASPKLSPAVPATTFNLLKSEVTVYGANLSFAAQFANLKGRNCVVVLRLCDRDGDLVSQDRLHHTLIEVDVVPSEAQHTSPFFVNVPEERIAEIYGENVKTIFVRCTVADASTGKPVAPDRMIAINVVKKPTSPILPRGF